MQQWKWTVFKFYLKIHVTPPNKAEYIMDKTCIGWFKLQTAEVIESLSWPT